MCGTIVPKLFGHGDKSRALEHKTVFLASLRSILLLLLNLSNNQRHFEETGKSIFLPADVVH